MSEPRKMPIEWATPQNLFTVAAALWGIYGSYIGFQKDTTVAVATLQTEVRHLRTDVERNALDLRDLRNARGEK